MAIHDASDLIYETNDKGEQVVVRSIQSTVRTFLRFSNRTNRDVDIYWRDFNGKRTKYARIPSGGYYDVNSYLTHPWEFRDAATDEVYAVNNKPYFRAPNNTGGMMYRTNWNIHIGMRSLKETTLLAIASRVRDPNNVSRLEIPRALQREILELMDTLNRNVDRAENGGDDS